MTTTHSPHHHFYDHLVPEGWGRRLAACAIGIAAIGATVVGIRAVDGNDPAPVAPPDRVVAPAAAVGPSILLDGEAFHAAVAAAVDRAVADVQNDRSALLDAEAFQVAVDEAVAGLGQ